MCENHLGALGQLPLKTRLGDLRGIGVALRGIPGFFRVIEALDKGIGADKKHHKTESPWAVLSSLEFQIYL